MRASEAGVCLVLGWAALVSAEEAERKPVPTYTNDDLRRLKALRYQTGALTRPASRSQRGTRAASVAGRARDPIRAERYWRREAERLRRRLRPLRDKVARLKRRIDRRWRQPGVRPITDPKLEDWRLELGALQERIRDERSRFEDRARREGALPGWLR